MTVIKVLGPGCSKCVQTAKLIATVAEELGVELEIEKETELAAILGYGALSTPGVVIDETLVHTGGVPSSTQVREWLSKV